MRIISFLFVSSIVLAASALGAASSPNVGDRPPPLGLEKLLQAPADADTSWDALKGKIVVLEFWATWCGPCIEAIPHLNELADQFKGKPVQFIAITDEKENVVAPFLKGKSIHAWVGLDLDKSVHRDYAISGIPHTVVVNQRGEIAAITYPTVLNEKHLNGLLAGKKLALSQPKQEKNEGVRPGELPGSSKQGRESLFQVLIQPSEGPTGSSARRKGNLTILGSSVFGVLSSCYNISPVRIITNSALPDGNFDFVVKTPDKSNEAVQALLRQAVETTFDISTKRETKDMDVFLLTLGEQKDNRLTLTVSTGGSSASSGPDGMRAVNESLAGLAWNLENLLKRPVINETGLTNHYDWNLKWKFEDPKSPEPDTIAKVLHDKLGLELTPAKRVVEILVVDTLSK